MATIDDDVQAYIDAIAPEQRPLFDRVHGLLVAAHPDVCVELAYKMPTYRANGHGVHVASWKHGVSLYGWTTERTAGFADRHPDLVGDKGTLRITTEAATDIPDAELRELLTAILEA